MAFVGGPGYPPPGSSGPPWQVGWYTLWYRKGGGSGHPPPILNSRSGTTKSFRGMKGNGILDYPKAGTRQEMSWGVRSNLLQHKMVKKLSEPQKALKQRSVIHERNNETYLIEHPGQAGVGPPGLKGGVPAKRKVGRDRFSGMPACGGGA